MHRVAEFVSIFALLVYVSVVLSQWTVYRLELVHPLTIAIEIAAVLGLVWFSPLVALFVVAAVAATYLVNEIARSREEGNMRRPTIEATRADIVGAPVAWPYLPSDKTQSNEVAPYGRGISDRS